MSRKRYAPEQIIGKLRGAEVALAQAQTASQVCRTLGLAGPTFSRWRWECAGLRGSGPAPFRQTDRQGAQSSSGQDL
jgi:putative transposase